MIKTTNYTDRTKEKETIYIHFTFKDLTVENFLFAVQTKLKLNSIYSLLIKIASYNNSIFKMCGTQIGLVFKNEFDINHLKMLYEVIITRIEETEDLYDFMGEIEIVEIKFSKLSLQKELLLKNFKNITINKQNIKVNEVKKNFKLLPLFSNSNLSFSGNIVISTDKDINIKKVNKNLTILEKFDKNLKLTNLDDIYIYTTPKSVNRKIKQYIIALRKEKLDKQIINNIYIYDFNTGIFISKILDRYLIEKKQNILISRTTGNTTWAIDKENISEIKSLCIIKPISPLIKKETERNTRFGAFDLETYLDSEGTAKVYAFGFINNIDISLDAEPKLYYLSDYPEYDSWDFILKCIDDMLINKYHQSIFYSHNLSSYEVIFIYNVLLNYNESIGFEHYNLKTTMRENKIIRLDIIIYNEKSDYKEYINKTDKKHKLKKKKYIKISFVDSLNFFNSSLEKITKDLNLGFQKGKFPHFFASRNNLNYRGNKPKITYYPNIDTKEYDLIPKENWDFKSECLKYLRIDVLSLFTIISQFNRLIFFILEFKY